MNRLKLVFSVFFLLASFLLVSSQSLAAPGGTARLIAPDSGRNLVGRSEMLQSGGGNDAVFQAVILGENRLITSMEIRNLNGVYSVWDTMPGNGMWLSGVVVDDQVVNLNDGSISYQPGAGETRFDIYCEDNGSARGGQTRYQLTIGFASGDPLVLNVLDPDDPEPSVPGNGSNATPTAASGRSEWDTNFNKVFFDQKGQNLSGHYEYASGKVKGNLKGMTMEGWWSEDDDTKDCGPDNAWSGPFVLTFANDGKSFTGIWGKCQGGKRTIESLTTSDGDWHGNLSKGAIDFNSAQASGNPIANDNIVQEDLNVDDLIQELKIIISTTGKN